MSDPKLIVTKSDGTILFDTRRVTYGLVKSGYMHYLQTWGRRIYIGGPGGDSSWGGNWSNPGVVSAGSSNSDDIYGFTVQNAKSPIVFIVSSNGGSLNSSTRNSDGSMTFYYTGADQDTKFFCFDLMGDNISGKPYLKTYKDDGALTFNSLQPPLNVYGQYQPPTGSGATPYSGGSNVLIRDQISGGVARGFILRHFLNINIGAGEFAAHLPWSRGGSVQPGLNVSSNAASFIISVTEGVFGRNGGITFCFCETGSTPQTNNANTVASTIFRNIVNSPRPTALIIKTENLPFPFN